jgi:hypothetical protein
MNRQQFEHAIRAAGAILGKPDVLVIGSQAIHASTEVLVPEAARSIEVDVASLNDPDGHYADLIDGSIGELSIFQETFGYYAQGVTPDTAVLPSGWRKRLIPYRTPSTNGVTAHCLEIHDLWISKAIAGRPKDMEFCTALLKLKLVDSDTLQERLKRVTKLNPKVRERVKRLIRPTSG